MSTQTIIPAMLDYTRMRIREQHGNEAGVKETPESYDCGEDIHFSPYLLANIAHPVIITALEVYQRDMQAYNNVMKTLIVDIDNTLWDLAPVLYERMRKVNPALVPPSEWYEFDLWKRYISPGAFFSLIRDIHMDQHMFTPYPDAGSLSDIIKGDRLPHHHRQSQNEGDARYNGAMAPDSQSCI